ncbi:MAG TPA: ABC transporter ATP-binding protein [Hyphomicrobiaceae bacterium]|nr:ABC transporter ATP-binding protein [Hyphomicrobiaceae bacterium]
MSDALLSVRGLEAGYGGSQVLFGVDLDVGYGEVVSLLGRNGMGKTTTVLSIMGLLPARAGEIRFAGQPLTRQPPFRIAQAGIGLVPEGRQVFPTLTVEENLIATASNRGGQAAPWTLERVYAFFPRLAERRRNYGDEISGGEQQMLAIGRALMTNPKLLLLDEATEGLAPLTRQEIWKRLAQLKRDGLAILIIDKTVEALLRLSDRHVILEKGRIVWSGTSRVLAADPVTRDRYLSV